ncbi:HemK2/MTQ2 family protein methyltransferase [Rhodococcus artemisiae]|uniref:Methyltransferase n=1 Tax=Rhodococcus artemisiae TaxID=714159 RepID=A0ABU7LEG8_9NOCA|nr:HemK2/MTQ2 family protein methyltransferase [Rhodococcus artemisiae]MEE2059307.1 methyltransferase [Rhodococcus artemisiae]
MTAPLLFIRKQPARVWRLPGVYRPQEDSFLLAQAMAESWGTDDARVLDFCTGTGFLAVTAADLGAASVTAVDISSRAVLTARLNVRARGLSVRVVRGDLGAAARSGPFDVVLSNPPYVPHENGDSDPRWDAGPDGRRILDPLCDELPTLLSSKGFALIVQSEFSGVDATLDRLQCGGLKAAVVARQSIPFGPVLRSRVRYLREVRLADEEAAQEEVVVIRAERTRTGGEADGVADA